MYNSSQVHLYWEARKPVTMGPDKILSEYVLTKTYTEESLVIADEKDLRHGAFVGNYSSISVGFTVVRQSGFYLLQYYVPSILIVGISWVSFWLQADQTAPRATLGATTMLSFITLSSSQTKILPKVSYIKASEVWSMVCIGFIFGSLVEFAFANLLWRRKKHVELKKVFKTQLNSNNNSLIKKKCLGKCEEYSEAHVDCKGNKRSAGD
jgi:Neurotransmitter-gated ion-channel transmembrane region